MGFVWKIAKTTKIPVIKYKSLYFSNLYSIFRRFSILFVNLITVHEVLPHDVIKVKKCSEPCIYGIASSYTFERDAEKANQIIKQEFVESEGKMVYLGEWHTHPTAIPSPSPTDKKSIKDILKNNHLASNIIIFIIVGRTLDYKGYFDGAKFYEF